MALNPGLDPPPFMANAILNFHFDYLNPSLSYLHVGPDQYLANHMPPILSFIFWNVEKYATIYKSCYAKTSSWKSRTPYVV